MRRGRGTNNAEDLQSHFIKALGGSVQIINKSGGAGTIAWNFVANSPANGQYTRALSTPARPWITFLLQESRLAIHAMDPIAFLISKSARIPVKNKFLPEAGNKQ
jgi:tripartite-type tricarboxylate transporter receptor subunit TctC